MKYLLSAQEMKQCDINTMEHFGVPSEVLMERAALSVVSEIQHRHLNTDNVLCVCGSGNNGGDGIAIARLLWLKGANVMISFVGNETKATKQTSMQLSIARAYGIPIVTEIPKDQKFTLILDCLFGIGLVREITGSYYELIDKLNQMSGTKIAVDIPSGICADDGSVMGIAFRADYTVTFGFTKLGQILYPGTEYCGVLIEKNMGIDVHSLLDIKPSAQMLEKEDLNRLPVRKNRSNKGTFGKVLIIAGTTNMAGAAALSAKAAYAAGAGLVRIYTTETNRQILQTTVPEAVLTTYQEAVFDVNQLNEVIAWADCIVIGPGLGTGDVSTELVRYTLSSVIVPCIIDADALNLVAMHPEFMHDACGDWIVTPHPAEMGRLTGRTAEEVLEDPVHAARAYTNQYSVITVQKDARTVIALPDGSVYVNSTGNHGMATGGSGDVLTGVIAALAAQGCTPSSAAPLGVFIHGLAGDLMSEEIGTYGLTASHIVEGIRMVMKEGENHVTLR